MAVCIDKDVLGFKVSMYDVVCVDVLNGKELYNRFSGRPTEETSETYEFCHVEPNRFHEIGRASCRERVSPYV